MIHGILYDSNGVCIHVHTCMYILCIHTQRLAESVPILIRGNFYDVKYFQIFLVAVIERDCRDYIG